jgi:hypothetical protein
MPTVLPLRSGEPRRVGRYRLTSRIGEAVSAGGGPDTFLGRSAEGEQVTVTLLGRSRAAAGAARDRFTAEARAARRVDPFCVARILDAGLQDGEPYLISEYVPGASLREVAADQGALAGAALAGLAIGSAAGLAAIHRAGLVHGAFGPDHVVLSPDGPRVVHFSITPPYGAATPAADLLAWALTVMFAALGRPPVGPQDLTALPEMLQPVVAACLAPNPAARPGARDVLTRLLDRDDPSAGLLAEATRRARSAARDIPRASPGTARPRRRARSRAVVWVLACVACLLALAAAGWFISLRPRGNQDAQAGTTSARPGSASPVRPGVPAAMAGTWAGQVHQTDPVLAVTVQITLTAGPAAGTIDYPALGCSGTLRPVSGKAGTVTLAQHITTGRGSCEDGVVSLTTQGPGRLTFSFRRAGGTNPGGVLTRVRPSPSPSRS